MNARLIAGGAITAFTFGTLTVFMEGPFQFVALTIAMGAAFFTGMAVQDA